MTHRCPGKGGGGGRVAGHAFKGGEEKGSRRETFRHGITIRHEGGVGLERECARSWDAGRSFEEAREAVGKR